MVKYITVQVLIPDHSKIGEFKELYRNSLEYDNSLEFPFSDLLRGLKLLYQKPDVRIVLGCEL